MTYIIQFSEKFQKQFNKIKKKLLEISNNPNHFKPLKNDLFGFRRIHIGSYVLIFKIKNNIVKLITIDHHDKVY